MKKYNFQKSKKHEVFNLDYLKDLILKKRITKDFQTELNDNLRIQSNYTNSNGNSIFKCKNKFHKDFLLKFFKNNQIIESILPIEHFNWIVYILKGINTKIYNSNDISKITIELMKENNYLTNSTFKVEKIIDKVLIIKINPLIINDLSNKGVYLDLNLLELYKYKNIAVCFKCCGYFHKIDQCSNNCTICIKCGSNHNFKNCKISINNYDCFNCRKLFPNNKNKRKHLSLVYLD